MCSDKGGSISAYKKKIGIKEVSGTRSPGATLQSVVERVCILILSQRMYQVGKMVAEIRSTVDI